MPLKGWIWLLIIGRKYASNQFVLSWDTRHSRSCSQGRPLVLKECKYFSVLSRRSSVFTPASTRNELIPRSSEASSETRSIPPWLVILDSWLAGLLAPLDFEDLRSSVQPFFIFCCCRICEQPDKTQRKELGKVVFLSPLSAELRAFLGKPQIAKQPHRYR